MTRQQKKIAATWAVVLLTFILLAIFDEWVEKNWDSIKWPSLFVIIIVVSLSRKQPVSAFQGRHNINDIIFSHPWIKLYMAIYCFIVVVVCFTVVSKDINPGESVGTVELFLAIFGIILPVLVVQQIQLFKDAGNKK